MAQDTFFAKRLSASYDFYDSISFSTRFQFESAFDTAGTVTNAFLHFEQLEYYSNDYLAAFLGHTNSNGLFNPETYQNNLKLYDNNSSEYYLGLTLSLQNYRKVVDQTLHLMESHMGIK